MNIIQKFGSNLITRIESDTIFRRLLYVVVLWCCALLSIACNGKQRYIFEFFSSKGKPVLEVRFLPKYGNLEQRVTLYVEEMLLGPGLQDALPLFSRESSVESVLVRKGIAYINFSEITSLSATQMRLQICSSLILRNFPFLKEVILFINGNEVYKKIK